MNNYKIGVEIELRINGEQRTVSYNLLVEAINEDKAMEKINEKYGLNDEEWNIDAIVEHIEEFIIDIKNTDFEIEEILYVESLNHANLETMKL